MFKRLQAKLHFVAERIYEQALDGLPGFQSAESLAADYRARGGSLVQRADDLIASQVMWSGSMGFATQLGGLVSAPIAMPAHGLVLLAVRIRMLAGLAALGGHDVRDPGLRTVVLACLTGLDDAHRDVDEVHLGRPLSAAALRGITPATARAVRDRVAAELLRDCTRRGVIRRGRLVPIIGGVVGGSMDAAMTLRIGELARDTFVRRARARKLTRKTSS